MKYSGSKSVCTHFKLVLLNSTALFMLYYPVSYIVITFQSAQMSCLIGGIPGLQCYYGKNIKWMMNIC